MTNQELVALVDELIALPKENEWVEFISSVSRIQNSGSRTKSSWVLIKINKEK